MATGSTRAASRSTPWTILVGPLEVDIADTELEERPFVAVHRGDSEEDGSWMHCNVAGGKFQATGGVPDLPEMLERFLEWAGH